MSREDCERVIVKFVLDEVLKEDIHFTPYNNICYLVEGPRISLATRGKIALSLDFKYEATETESSNPDIHETFASPKSAVRQQRLKCYQLIVTIVTILYFLIIS